MQRTDQTITSVRGEKSFALWRDATYLAAGYDDGTVIRLDICRRDLGDGIGWDELQRIKRECGYGALDAMELYPADDAVINTANVRHLYLFRQPIPHVWRPHVQSKQRRADGR